MTKKVMKIRPKKNNACTGLEPITSAIPVQCSTNTQLPCCFSSVHFKPEKKENRSAGYLIFLFRSN